MWNDNAASTIPNSSEMKLNLQSIHAVPNRNNKTSTVLLGVEVNNAASTIPNSKFQIPNCL